MSMSDRTVDRRGDIFVITLHRGLENKLNLGLCQALIRTYHDIQKHWDRIQKELSYVVDLIISSSQQYLIQTLLDFPFPTIACITGHTFGGACPFALAHDYRIMNSDRGYFCMPPVDLGLHFEGMGALLRAKLGPRVACKVLLEAHRYTGKSAFDDGIVDVVVKPEQRLDEALRIAEKWQDKSCGGVYGVLRNELLGDAIEKFQKLSYVHSRATSKLPREKL